MRTALTISGHGHELQPLGRPLGAALGHEPDAAHVELVVDDARLERRPLARLERAERAVGHGQRHAAADDPEAILGVAGEVLLVERVPDARVRGHDHALPRAPDAGAPRALGALHAAVHVELARRLAEVPDGAGAVLGVPVGGVLGEPAGEVEAVAHHAAADAG